MYFWGGKLKSVSPHNLLGGEIFLDKKAIKNRFKHVLTGIFFDNLAYFGHFALDKKPCQKGTNAEGILTEKNLLPYIL